MTSDARRWLPYGAGRPDRVRLLCLPHAGAGASAYRAWGAGLPSWIDVCPVQPPGRETRLTEPPYHEMGALVADLAGALLGVLDGPYAVFGHSLGALVGYELVREIRRRGGPAPVHVFVAGAAAPHLADPTPEAGQLTVEQLADLLRTLGGTPSEILADARVLTLFAPLFRADLSVKETYRWTPEAPLEAPLTAFGADRDPRAGWEQVEAWRSRTAGGFTHQVLAGGHFAVLEQAALVHTHVRAALAEAG
ncbi:thioesterase II family protein [Micromonospora echinospora]|uniref:thioesterase II family protein n=1 Tax=Micromonospora echinospora TaxID=1877 RepID=UPI0037A29C72